MATATQTQEKVTPRLKLTYQEQVVPRLMEKFNLKNPMAVRLAPSEGRAQEPCPADRRSGA